ncbi:MAG: filamentous hemagglutinin N-terminal domain-containing protein [Caulobacteraceae bacterium]
MVAKQAVRTEFRLQGVAWQGSGRSRRAALLGAASALFGAGTAMPWRPGPCPRTPTVAGGAATFARSGQTLTVDQSTSRTVIDWRSFDIGAGAQTTFNQPSASAIAVNRINAGTDPTHIDGALRANGQVWVLNPNGVMFGKGAVVNVAGIVASTANIDAARFMAGDNRLTFTGADRGFVANDGAITVADNGLAAFVAPSVRNSGAINARVGKVTLAAGSTFTLDLAGDRLIEIGLGAGHAVVDQSGAIVDEGGVVTLSARSAGQVVDSVINMSGVVSTASARLAGGQIVLEGDTANLTGAADASGTSGGRIALAANTIGIGPQASLRADSLADGNGGTITAIAAGHGDYAGAYSARGGPSGGAGGKIETSGASVAVDGAIKVDASAAKGAAGEWLIDPLDVTITSGSGGGFTGSTVTTGAIQTALAGGTGVHITTDQTGTDNGDLTLASSITAASTGNAGLTLDGRHLSATGGSKINIAGGALTLNVNTVNTLADTSGQPTNWANDALGMIGTVSGGTTVNLGAAKYASGININKSKVTLLGTLGAEIDFDPDGAEIRAITVSGGDGVTVSGFKIRGEITGSYINYNFGSGKSEGVYVVAGATNVTISNNDIQNVRTGILVDGFSNGAYNTGSITNNLIDNTKGAVAVQWSDANNNAGHPLVISNNTQGAFGNEWGVNFHLQGPPTGAAPTDVQQALLDNSAANAGWAVQDQAYASSNRTAVTVAASATNANANPSDGNQGSYRSPLATIQAGVTAVVSGGTVKVNDGAYVVNAANGYANGYLGITKSLSLIGQSQAGTVIDAHGASQYGLRVSADNVSLSNFTLLGAWTPTGNSYGIKVENTVDSAGSIYNLSISNVTSHGARKAQLDMSGVVGAAIDHFTADGTSNGAGAGSLAGAGIAITDSANVTITNSSTHDNAYGGLALYETNTTRTQQVTGITVAANNSFAESVPVYAEDASASKDFGALSIGGFPYIVRPSTNPADVVTVFQPTQQAAIDYAVAAAPSTAWIQGYGSGVIGNNVFTVGVSSAGGHQTMSILAALRGAQSGATVNVNNGTYVIPGGGGSYLLIDKSLSLIGQSQDGVIIDARNADTYAVRVDGTSAAPISNVTLSNLTFYGVTGGTAGYGVKVEGVNGLTLSNITSQGAQKSEFDLNGVVGGTLDHLTANGAPVGGGGQYRRQRHLDHRQPEPDPDQFDHPEQRLGRAGPVPDQPAWRLRLPGQQHRHRHDQRLRRSQPGLSGGPVLDQRLRDAEHRRLRLSGEGAGQSRRCLHLVPEDPAGRHRHGGGSIPVHGHGPELQRLGQRGRQHLHGRHLDRRSGPVDQGRARRGPDRRHRDRERRDLCDPGRRDQLPGHQQEPDPAGREPGPHDHRCERRDGLWAAGAGRQRHAPRFHSAGLEGHGRLRRQGRADEPVGPQRPGQQLRDQPRHHRRGDQEHPGPQRRPQRDHRRRHGQERPGGQRHRADRQRQRGDHQFHDRQQRLGRPAHRREERQLQPADQRHHRGRQQHLQRSLARLSGGRLRDQGFRDGEHRGLRLCGEGPEQLDRRLHLVPEDPAGRGQLRHRCFLEWRQRDPGHRDCAGLWRQRHRRQQHLHRRRRQQRRQALAHDGV